MQGLSCGPVNGTVDGLNDGDLCMVYAPSANFEGVDNICVVVCDLSGACDTLAVELNVLPDNNPPQVLGTDKLPSDTIAKAVMIDVSNEICLDAIDIDGDQVMISGILNGPFNGTAGGLGDGDLCMEYTPGNGFSGIDTIQVVVCDDGMPIACDTTFILIVVGGNNSPIAVNDTVTVSKSTSINVLDNDFDIDGNIDETSVTITNLPVNGNVAVNADGTIIYTPADGFTGIDSLQYQVCDNFTVPLCATATVYITVTSLPSSEFLISNFVSPNGDGSNDVFIIRGIENYPDNEVIIFNRWGNKLYSQTGYDHNDPEKSWSGNSNKGFRLGSELPDGTYFYIIKLNDDEGREFSGFLELRK